jgi:hypothetical protein
MNMIREVTTNVQKEAAEGQPFGPGFDHALASKADRMEVWGSSFVDPGPDFCEYRLFEKGVRIATKRVDGY